MKFTRGTWEKVVSVSLIWQLGHVGKGAEAFAETPYCVRPATGSGDDVISSSRFSTHNFVQKKVFYFVLEMPRDHEFGSPPSPESLLGPAPCCTDNPWVVTGALQNEVELRNFQAHDDATNTPHCAPEPSIRSQSLLTATPGTSRP